MSHTHHSTCEDYFSDRAILVKLELYDVNKAYENLFEDFKLFIEENDPRVEEQEIFESYSYTLALAFLKKGETAKIHEIIASLESIKDKHEYMIYNLKYNLACYYINQNLLDKAFPIILEILSEEVEGFYIPSLFIHKIIYLKKYELGALFLREYPYIHQRLALSKILLEAIKKDSCENTSNIIFELKKFCYNDSYSLAWYCLFYAYFNDLDKIMGKINLIEELKIKNHLLDLCYRQFKKQGKFDAARIFRRIKRHLNL